MLVSEFLIRRLGEHSLFPEVTGQVDAGLRDGIKDGVGKVVRGGSVTPGQCIAVISTSHHQYLLGLNKSSDCQPLGAVVRGTIAEPQISVTFLQNGVGLASLVPLVPFHIGAMESLAKMVTPGIPVTVFMEYLTPGPA